MVLRITVPVLVGVCVCLRVRSASERKEVGKKGGKRKEGLLANAKATMCVCVRGLGSEGGDLRTARLPSTSSRSTIKKLRTWHMQIKKNTQSNEGLMSRM